MSYVPPSPYEKTVVKDGQLVALAPHSLLDAAAEVAKATRGTVHFTCPNYALVLTNTDSIGLIAGQCEDITIWAK